MERRITIICNIILFLLLIFHVNEAADMVVGITSITLICLFIFYLIRYRKKYIDKNIILIYIISLLLQMMLIYILGILNIWEVSSGFMGLGGGPFGVLIYFIFQIFFIGIIIIINIFKYIIYKIKKFI